MVCIHVLKIAKVLVSAWTLYVLINLFVSVHLQCSHTF